MKERKLRVRIRCPFCGRLAWDTWFNKSYPIEAFVQGSYGRTYGIKPCFFYKPIANKEYLDQVKEVFLTKCKQILEKLKYAAEFTIVYDYEVIKQQQPQRIYEGELVWSK